MGRSEADDEMTALFDYASFTTRNFGFVTKDEQAKLRAASIFVAGVGGMGGACVMALARAGVGRLIFADIDAFEISNLNRQVFAFTDTIGRPKAQATAEILARINPEMKSETLGGEWADRLVEIAGRVRVIVNGTDDLGAGLHLYRTARKIGVPVVDAYTAPLPSVTVVRPGNPMPEERLGFPTLGKAWNAIGPDERRAALIAEIEYVLVHSSARHHVDLGAAAEVAVGKRSRMSFAPLVIGAGVLMAQEAINCVLDRPSRTDYRGWFLNPYRPAVERPRNPLVAAVFKPIVRRFIKRMMASA
jgi:molybdopterin-synthase adenylyltransferase